MRSAPYYALVQKPIDRSISFSFMFRSLDFISQPAKQQQQLYTKVLTTIARARIRMRCDSSSTRTTSRSPGRFIFTLCWFRHRFCALSRLTKQKPFVSQSGRRHWYATQRRLDSTTVEQIQIATRNSSKLKSTFVLFVSSLFAPRVIFLARFAADLFQYMQVRQLFIIFSSSLTYSECLSSINIR